MSTRETLSRPYARAAFELALDLRFGLFELRSRGGWWQF